MDIRSAAKMMLDKKYEELEALHEEIEIYEFIVNDTCVAEELEAVMNTPRYPDGEVVVGKEYVDLMPEDAKRILESNRMEVRSRIEKEMLDVVRKSHQIG